MTKVHGEMTKVHGKQRFVLSRPGDKNKDVARVEHPA